MATQKITVEERNHWRQLYALADRLNRLDPWPWMSSADCFGLKVPGYDDPCFVVFNGASQKFRNVRFLLGWKAFYDLLTRLADPSKQVSSWLLEIRMVELLYVNDSLLFDHERPLLRMLKRVPSESFETPVFRSIIPGYHPWRPDEKERTLLSTALYEAFGMAMRVEANGDLLRSRFPREILIREQGTDGVWQDTWSPVKELGDEAVDVRIESKDLQTLQRLALKPVTLQIDLVFTPMRLLPSGTRPQTAYVLLVVEAESGLIVAGEMLQATDGIAHMWSQTPGLLLRIFERFGGCPQTIEVRADRMANLLRPLGEFLPFKMVRREKLEMLERAHEHLSQFITGRHSQST